MSTVKDGKITWHMTNGPPEKAGAWSDLIYIGRPFPPNGRRTWRDGSTARSPKVDDPKQKPEPTPWDPEHHARIVAMLERQGRVGEDESGVLPKAEDGEASHD